jgi:uncharacterized protein
MPEELPKFIDTRRLVEQRGAVAGIVSPARLRRVSAPYVAGDPVIVTLEASTEEGLGVRITGEVRTTVGATCQRCLDDMTVTIDKRINAILVDAADPVADAGDKALEVIAVVDDRLDIEQLVEDEVLLGCPMIPMHDDLKCHVAPDDTTSNGQQRKRPFAGLDDLLAAAGEKREPGK